MATGPISAVIRDLRRAALLRDAAGLTDGQLLEWFLARRDEAAFEALVRRHGPMVLGVCRRILRHAQDAEDAFQATFLVLMRKAASIAKRDVLGAWLYGVAYRIAVRSKAMTARRRMKERQVRDWPRTNGADPAVWHDLEPLLDQEVSRLPAKYRVPLVLCELDGLGRKEAARHLGLPEGTLSSRLARGRELLRQRLARRGLALGAGLLAAALSPQAASARVPTALAAATVRAAGLFGAAGPAAVGGAVSAQAVALADGAVRALLLNKLKVGLALLLGAGLLTAAVGAGAGARRALVGKQAAHAPADDDPDDSALAALCPADDAPPAAEAMSPAADPDDLLPQAEPGDGDEPAPPVTAPPAGLRCDPFYKKHVSARGLPILSSEKVSDRALHEAAYLVNHVLENRPDVREAMIRADVRFVVMHESEKTTDLPGQRDLKPKEAWDRVRALGDRLDNCGEENLLNLPGDRYPGKSILLHAVAHCVHLKGLNRLDKDFDRRLRRAYKDALAQGLWKGTRAASNYAEYWAETVQSYFDSNNNPAKPGGAANHVNTREELEVYDPGAFRLIDDVFRKTKWRYQPPDQRK